MYSAYLLLFILTIRTDGFTLDHKQCHYIFETCDGDVSNNLVTYDSSDINYCSIKDVPTEFNYTFIKIPAENQKGRFISYLEIDFEAPKTECGYGVTLLIEPSIQNERECLQYKFEDITANIHTKEQSVCVLTNSSNQFVRYNDNSTVSLCKDHITLDFYYIFTGCYALRFHFDRWRYIIRGHKFLNTTYKRTDVEKPDFSCKYVYPTSDQRYTNIFQISPTYLETQNYIITLLNQFSIKNPRYGITNFILDTSVPANIPVLKVGIIQNDYKTSNCKMYVPPEKSWFVKLWKNEAENCSINEVQKNTEEYMKTVQCNFQEHFPMTQTGYCMVLIVRDKRCLVQNAIWNPPMESGQSCTWLKECVGISETSYIESVTESSKLQLTDSYLWLPIIIIILVVLAIVGALYFIHYLRLRNDAVNLYVNPQQDDFTYPACVKSTDFDIVETNDRKKDLDRDNLAYDDIVLVYTKSSVSFMAMMKDFREMLTKMCSCTVHDWHDGAEWNDVARVGAVLWFTRLLSSGCRVVWIDTPATRSIVISNSRESDTNLNKLSKYYEIGDFRDVAFPVVLELAKRNMKDLMFQYRKHFVVRFEGLESSENVNDPYLDLSPHARYLMPQHFAQLCSDLSAIPAGSRYEMKTEEDLLQQRLKFMKTESIM